MLATLIVHLSSFIFHYLHSTPIIAVINSFITLRCRVLRVVHPSLFYYTSTILVKNVKAKVRFITSLE